MNKLINKLISEHKKEWNAYKKEQGLDYIALSDKAEFLFERGYLDLQTYNNAKVETV